MEAALCPRSVLQQRALALSPAAPGRPGQRRLLGVRAPRGFRGQREAKGGPARGRLLRCPPLPLQVFLTSPTEVAKVRLQTQTQQRRPSASGPSAAPPMCPAPPAGSVPGPKYRGPLHCLATVAREEGLRGLYKGSSALLFRDGHSFATYFLSYTILCEQLTPAGHSQPDVLGVLLAGGCAGVLAWAVATPMDVIKSRLQADGQGQRRYRGLLHCVVTSVREEGPRVLFKGLTLNCCRAFPVNMVVFVTYEAVLRLIRGLST